MLEEGPGATEVPAAEAGRGPRCPLQVTSQHGVVMRTLVHRPSISAGLTVIVALIAHGPAAAQMRARTTSANDTPDRVAVPFAGTYQVTLALGPDTARSARNALMICSSYRLVRAIPAVVRISSPDVRDAQR